MKHMQVIVFSVVVAPLLAAVPPAFEDLANLDAKVSAITGASTGSAGGAVAPIDRRLKLQKCPEAVTVDRLLSDAVAIRCVSMGWRLRVPLLASASRQIAETAPPVLVRRGEVVELVYEGAGFSVSISAVAAEDGARGKTIKLTTAPNGRPVYGIVTDINQVSISR